MKVVGKNMTRVPENTKPAVNQKIKEKSIRRIDEMKHSSVDHIRRRMGKLDSEWDIERMIETNASIGVLAGLLLGRLVDRRFYFLSGLAGVSLLVHAIQGWSVSLPMLRRLGFRTPREIDEERQVLINMLDERQHQEGRIGANR